MGHNPHFILNFYATCIQAIQYIEHVAGLRQADMAMSDCTTPNIARCAYLALRKTKLKALSSPMAKYNAQSTEKTSKLGWVVWKTSRSSIALE